MLFAGDEPDLREMYAKLLATTMDPARSKLGHPSFVGLIQQLTSDEAKILRYLWSLGEGNCVWSGAQGKSELRTELAELSLKAGTTVPENADLYFENLLRLGVLKRFTEAESEYHTRGTFDTGSPPKVSTTNYEVIEMTPYGMAFLKVCIADNTPDNETDADSDNSKK